MTTLVSATVPTPSWTSGPWHGRAFGLELEANFTIPCASSTFRHRVPRRTSLEAMSPSELETHWRRRDAVTIADPRWPGGRRVITIEYHDEVGYRIWASRHGRHIVSSDGVQIRSALPRVAPWRWQRLLFAQVLPLAALLQGLELFHASAVAIGDRAVAFSAPSGTGKTSVASHLVARGAQLITDDVLALELTGRGVQAHAGAGIAGVHAAELRAMTADGRSRLGPEIGRDDKVYLATELSDRPMPLGALYFLSRGPRFEQLEIEESAPPDPRLLLGSSFLAYLRTRERLTNLLDICARIASSAQIFHVRVPPGIPAIEVAQEIESHVQTALNQQRSL
jgi:hypothetical protein